MADQYSVRFEVRLRTMFVPVIGLLYSPLAKKFPGGALWHWVASEYPEHAFIREFALAHDTDAIPFGPDPWAAEEPSGLDGDTWKVTCQIPDYKAMQDFFKMVLSPMIYQNIKCRILKNRYEIVQPMIVQPEEKTGLNPLASDISMTELLSCGDYHPVAAFHALWNHSVEHKREWEDEALYLLDQVRSYDGMVKSPESFMKICEAAFPELLGKGIPDTLKEILKEELLKAPIYDR